MGGGGCYNVNRELIVDKVPIFASYERKTKTVINYRINKCSKTLCSLFCKNYLLCCLL